MTGQNRQKTKKASRQKKKGKVRNIAIGTYTKQLDHCFRQVLPYTELQVFIHKAFSKVKQ